MFYETFALSTGFVGLFNVLILWPGILILHYADWETFTLPTRSECLLLLVNGLVGTVLSELLWLWLVTDRQTDRPYIVYRLMKPHRIRATSLCIL